MSQLTISKISNLDSIVIKQVGGKGFFLSAPDAIVISITSLTFILNFMIKHGIMSPKVLEGILEEYYSSGSEIKSGEANAG